MGMHQRSHYRNHERNTSKCRTFCCIIILVIVCLALAALIIGALCYQQVDNGNPLNTNIDFCPSLDVGGRLSLLIVGAILFSVCFFLIICCCCCCMAICDCIF